MDAFVGTKLRELDEAGLLETTIVIYYSDHAGALPRGKRFLYDSGTLVPLIIRVPERFRNLAPQAAGTVCEDQVSLIDLGPTVLSWCGIPLPMGLHGRAIAGPAKSPAPSVGFAFRDRMDEKFDSSRAVYDKRFTYIRNYDPLVPHGQHLSYLWQAASMRAWAQAFAVGALTPSQAAFFQPKAVEELYDRTADPDHVTNLAADPTYAAELARLRAALHHRLVAIRDSVAAPEPLLQERRGLQPPMTWLADDHRYPLARLLGLIDRIQVQRDAETVAASLTDPDPLVRWWGASGSALLADEPADLMARLDDPVIAVRVAAAESILRRRPDPAAIGVLNDVLTTQAGWPMRLAAANTISRLGDRAPFRAALEATRQDEEYSKRIVPWLLGQ